MVRARRATSKRWPAPGARGISTSIMSVPTREPRVRVARFPRSPWAVAAYPIGVFVLMLALRIANAPREPFEWWFVGGLAAICFVWACVRWRMSCIDVFVDGIAWRGRFHPWERISGVDPGDPRAGRPGALILSGGQRVSFGSARRHEAQLVVRIREGLETDRAGGSA